MGSYGFIITRHVISEKTNKYWNQCIKCLRTLYPLKKIVIIDDNSDKNYLKPDFSYNNISIIDSQFKGRGELLPYYYYIKNKFFDNAIIIHDSVFLHKRLNIEKLVLTSTNVLPLWHFNADKENITNTLRISNALKNGLSIKQKITLNDSILGMPYTKWYGCFGVQSFINHRFLLHLEAKYNITNMISYVSCRSDRCCLERIMGCIFCTEYPNLIKIKSLLGDIMKYLPWGYTYDEYNNNFQSGKLPKAIIKVWTGR